MKNNFFSLFLLLFTIPHFAFSQYNSTCEPKYAVHVNYPSLSISKENLKDAKTLKDLDKFYKPGWVKKYISVEILTQYKGKTRKTESKNDTLTQLQKEHLNLTDSGSKISVLVRYIPDNTLKHNDVKEHSFTFIIDPETNAKYPGGEEELKKHLTKNLFEKYSPNVLKQYQLATAKFTIDEAGRVTDPHIFWTSEDEKTDKLLLETICNMPSWQPAEYEDGTKIKQEFVLTFGDPKSCVVNLLNIRDSLYRLIPE